MQHYTTCTRGILVKVIIARSRIVINFTASNHIFPYHWTEHMLGSSQWQLVDQTQPLCEGTRIKVGANSRASLLLPNNILFQLQIETVII